MLYKDLLGLHKVMLHLTQRQNNLSCRGPLAISGPTSLSKQSQLWS